MSKSCRIGLVMQGNSNWMGGVEYIKNIVFALSKLPKDVRDKFELCLICDKSIDSSLYESIVPYLQHIFYIEKENRFKAVFERIWKTCSQECLSSIGISNFLIANPDHNLSFIYPYVKTSEDLMNAAWIPDFQHKYLPHLFNLSDIFFKNISFKYISKHSNKIILSSKSAESDFHKFFPASQAEVVVLPFAIFPLPQWYCENPEEILKNYSLPNRFFLVSNQFWKHKNHKLVFKAMEILKKMNVEINIICTGNLKDYRNKNHIQEVREMVRNLGLDNQVHLLGLIPKQDQVQIMRCSLAMIQPSLFEGWSTAVEDARALGKKIAVSSIPVHLEQNPPGAKFFDKDSPIELADILKAWWESEEAGFNPLQEEIAKKEALIQMEKIAYSFLSATGIIF
jgi:glycosyltransferase involved in cell wall biosynthesis